jgi:thiosulfate/3-mercaptopyruvate sulfurtransferase
MTRPGSQHFRPGGDMREILLKGNVSRGRRMICYDGSGVAAAKLAFVLTLVGHDDVAVYDGGWAEWGNRWDLPVDR